MQRTKNEDYDEFRSLEASDAKGRWLLRQISICVGYIEHNTKKLFLGYAVEWVYWQPDRAAYLRTFTEIGHV